MIEITLKRNGNGLTHYSKKQKSYLKMNRSRYKSLYSEYAAVEVSPENWLHQLHADITWELTADWCIKNTMPTPRRDRSSYLCSEKKHCIYK